MRVAAFRRDEARAAVLALLGEPFHDLVLRLELAHEAIELILPVTQLADVAKPTRVHVALPTHDELR